jgi:hypothetical protein
MGAVVELGTPANAVEAAALNKMLKIKRALSLTLRTILIFNKLNMSLVSSLIYSSGLALAILSLSACSSDDAPADGGMTTNMDAAPVADGGVAEDTGVDPICTEKTDPPCVDEQIQELLLFNNVSTGVISQDDLTDGVFTTSIDARGGGLMPTESFVYARFTASGLEKVDISDEQAFDSLDWDIAFRRYLIRLNSGISGPSCTQAGRVPNVVDLAAVTEISGDVTLRSEAYFTEPNCEIVPDGSGLPGAAAVALGAYWTYASCLQMTGNVFVIALADGHQVKLQVQHYYAEPGAQDACDDTGTVPMPSGAAQFEIKWAFIK